MANPFGAFNTAPNNGGNVSPGNAFGFGQQPAPQHAGPDQTANPNPFLTPLTKVPGLTGVASAFPSNPSPFAGGGPFGGGVGGGGAFGGGAFGTGQADAGAGDAGQLAKKPILGALMGRSAAPTAPTFGPGATQGAPAFGAPAAAAAAVAAPSAAAGNVFGFGAAAAAGAPAAQAKPFGGATGVAAAAAPGVAAGNPAAQFLRRDKKPKGPAGAAPNANAARRPTNEDVSIVPQRRAPAAAPAALSLEIAVPNAAAAAAPPGERALSFLTPAARIPVLSASAKRFTNATQVQVDSCGGAEIAALLSEGGAAEGYEEGAMRGVCQTLCPTSEASERAQRTDTIHSMEQATGVFIKSFKRSEAGMIWTPAELRTPSALLRTQNYLFSLMDLPAGAPFQLDELAYGFIEDRMRAVRNDISIQGLFTPLTAALQEEHVRFMLVAHYLFSGNVQEIPDGYDRQTNIEQSAKALTTLSKGTYPKVRARGADCPGEAESLAYQLLLVQNRAGARDLIQVQELLGGLPTEVVGAPAVRAALRLLQLMQQGNVASYFGLLKDLVSLASPANRTPLLLALAGHGLTPQVRFQALSAMRVALVPSSAKPVAVPLEDIRAPFGFETLEEAAAFLAHYGVECRGISVPGAAAANDDSEGGSGMEDGGGGGGGGPIALLTRSTTDRPLTDFPPTKLALITEKLESANILQWIRHAEVANQFAVGNAPKTAPAPAPAPRKFPAPARHPAAPSGSSRLATVATRPAPLQQQPTTSAPSAAAPTFSPPSGNVFGFGAPTTAATAAPAPTATAATATTSPPPGLAAAPSASAFGFGAPAQPPLQPSISPLHPTPAAAAAVPSPFGFRGTEAPSAGALPAPGGSDRPAKPSVSFARPADSTSGQIVGDFKPPASFARPTDSTVGQIVGDFPTKPSVSFARPTDSTVGQLVGGAASTSSFSFGAPTSAAPAPNLSHPAHAPGGSQPSDTLQLETGLRQRGDADRARQAEAATARAQASSRQRAAEAEAQAARHRFEREENARREGEEAERKARAAAAEADRRQRAAAERQRQEEAARAARVRRAKILAGARVKLRGAFLMLKMARLLERVRAILAHAREQERIREALLGCSVRGAPRGSIPKRVRPMLSARDLSPLPAALSSDRATKKRRTFEAAAGADPVGLTDLTLEDPAVEFRREGPPPPRSVSPWAGDASPIYPLDVPSIVGPTLHKRHPALPCLPFKLLIASSNGPQPPPSPLLAWLRAKLAVTFAPFAPTRAAWRDVEEKGGLLLSLYTRPAVEAPDLAISPPVAVVAVECALSALNDWRHGVAALLVPVDQESESDAQIAALRLGAPVLFLAPTQARAQAFRALLEARVQSDGKSPAPRAPCKVLALDGEKLLPSPLGAAPYDALAAFSAPALEAGLVWTAEKSAWLPSIQRTALTTLVQDTLPLDLPITHLVPRGRGAVPLTAAALVDLWNDALDAVDTILSRSARQAAAFPPPECASLAPAQAALLPPAAWASAAHMAKARQLVDCMRLPAFPAAPDAAVAAKRKSPAVRQLAPPPEARHVTASGLQEAAARLTVFLEATLGKDGDGDGDLVAVACRAVREGAAAGAASIGHRPADAPELLACVALRAAFPAVARALLQKLRPREWFVGVLPAVQEAVLRERRAREGRGAAARQGPTALAAAREAGGDAAGATPQRATPHTVTPNSPLGASPAGTCTPSGGILGRTPGEAQGMDAVATVVRPREEEAFLLELMAARTESRAFVSTLVQAVRSLPC